MFEQMNSSEVYDTNALDSMLLGESAAVESYKRAIRSVRNPEIVVVLERIRNDHQKAVCALRGWVRELQECSSAESGAWGFFESSITSMAALFGDTSLLAALKRGEQLGETMYRLGLGNPDLPDDFRHLVGSSLLPQCQEHVGKLEQLTALANARDVSERD